MRSAVLALALTLAASLPAGIACADEEADVRLFLVGGDIVVGKLISSAPDLVIVRARGDIRTFEPSQITRLETLASLGDRARSVRVATFPRIQFLGATVGLGSVAVLAFQSANDKQSQANDNRQAGLGSSAYASLESDAGRLRAIGWTAGALAAGTAVFALIPRWVDKKTFPEVGLSATGDRMVLSLLIRLPGNTVTSESKAGRQ